MLQSLSCWAYMKNVRGVPSAPDPGYLLGFLQPYMTKTFCEGKWDGAFGRTVSSSWCRLLTGNNLRSSGVLYYRDVEYVLYMLCSLELCVHAA
jgi:hypothetical protein